MDTELQPHEKTKLCQHCEGSVALNATECPYCGQSLTVQKVMARDKNTSAGVDSVREECEPAQDELFEPAYTPSSEVKLKVSEPQTNVSDPFANHKAEFARNEQISKGNPAYQPKEGRKQLLSIAVLTLGAQLFAIGLLILFFSTDGALVLQWKSSYWYAYCLAALPLLALGRFTLKKLPEYSQVAAGK